MAMGGYGIMPGKFEALAGWPSIRGTIVSSPPSRYSDGCRCSATLPIQRLRLRLRAAG